MKTNMKFEIVAIGSKRFTDKADIYKSLGRKTRAKSIRFCTGFLIHRSCILFSTHCYFASFL